MLSKIGNLARRVSAWTLSSRTNTFVFVAALIMLYTILAVAQALTKVPMDDEAWFASPALNLITKGYMGTSILETHGVMTRYTYYVMPLYFLVEAAWFKLIGFSLTSQRILSIAWGCLAIAACFSSTKSLFRDRGPAFLTIVFVALDVLFVRDAAMARMDMMAAALGFGAYAVYLTLRDKNLTIAIFCSQALVTLSGLTHPNGFMYFVGLLFLTLSMDWSQLRWRHVGLGAIPYVVGAACWSFYILKAPGLWWRQIRGNYNHRWRGFNILHNLWVDIHYRYFGTYGFGPADTGIRHLAVLLLIGYFAAILAALLIPGIRNRLGTRTLLILLATHSVLLSFNSDYNAPEYMVNIVPLFAAILAASIYWWWSTQPKQSWAIASLVSLFLALQISALVYRAYLDDYHKSYLPAVQFAARHTDDHSLVMGSAILAYEFGFRDNLVDDLGLGYVSHKVPSMVVIDREWGLQLENIRKNNPVLYQHIQNLLQNHYRKVYDHAWYQIFVPDEPIAVKQF